jgi:SnoaL-like domain
MSGTVEDRLKALEERLQYLEDVREINEVMRQWHYGCTGGFNGRQTHRTSETIDLVADDGSIEVQGLHEPGTGPKGREAMLAYFAPFHGDNGFLPHVYQTGVDYGVVVNGDTAVQHSNLLCITQYQDRGTQPEFLFSRYVNEFVRTTSGWKIRNIRLEQCYKTTLNDLIAADTYRPPNPVGD